MSDRGGSGAGDSSGGAARRPPRLDPLAVRRQLREEGLRARHSLSQNFLADPDILQAIVDIANPAPGSRVLEVGPGLGILTAALVDAGAMVTAVEVDPRLAGRLRRLSDADGRLRVVEGDILDQDLRRLIEPPYEVVANVPYHITSPILHRFLGPGPRPERLVLMVQREVAERISAAPGGMSYLSVFVQYHAAVRIALPVPREAFEPQPDVDSAVVVLESYVPGSGAAREAPGARRHLDEADEDELWRLVQAGFRERRKMLRNVLARQLPIPADRVDAALGATGIVGERRPQTLSVEEWLSLREALHPLPSVGGASASGHDSGDRKERRR